MKLTARTTASAALPEGKTDHIYWDTDLTGFGLRVRLGSDPERPALAVPRELQSLGIGRAEHLVRGEPHARRARPGLEFHSASSFIQNIIKSCAGR